MLAPLLVVMLSPVPSWALLLEGDMAVAQQVSGGDVKHAFVRATTGLWDKGVVSYLFDTYVDNGVTEYYFLDKTIELVNEVLHDIEEQVPCIHFV